MRKPVGAREAGRTCSKADVVGGNTAAGYGAQLISSEEVAAEFFAQAYAESLIGKVGAHRIPAQIPS